MRPSPTTLLGATLSFDRAGRARSDRAGTPDEPCACGDDRAADDPPCTCAEDRACPLEEQLALLTSGPRASAGVPSAIRTARASSPVIAPFATAVLHTPLTSASLVALDPRGRQRRRARREAGGTK